MRRASGTSRPSLEVDYELDLGRLLNGQIGRVGAFKDPIDVEGGSAIHMEIVGAIRDQSALSCPN
jgi:hypothetical protein